MISVASPLKTDIPVRIITYQRHIPLEHFLSFKKDADEQESFNGSY